MIPLVLVLLAQISIGGTRIVNAVIARPAAPGVSGLSLDPATATKGGTVQIPLRLNVPPGAIEPAGSQWTFTYSPSDIVSIAVAPGPAATAAAKGISCAGSAGSYICLATGINTNRIQSGTLALLTVTLSPTCAGTSIGVTGTLSATLSGDYLALTGTGAAITVK